MYVKARLASEFRQEFDCLKSRTFNDLHHAKDAYLNIVTGNVYHSKFTKAWFYQDTSQRYDIKPCSIYTHPVKCGNTVIWDGKPMLEKVQKTVHKQHAHMTRYAFCRKGGFFDQQPVSKAEGLIPLKKGLPTEKYGGYNKPTISFFILVKYTAGKKTDVMILPVQYLYAPNVLDSEQSAADYAKYYFSNVFQMEIEQISFPLGLRQLKINTMLSLDGFRACIASKYDDNYLSVFPFEPFNSSYKWNNYLKHIEHLIQKISSNPSYAFDEKNDKVNESDNWELYQLYENKLRSTIYQNRPSNPLQIIENGEKTFKKLTIAKQAEALLHIHDVFGRVSGGCDLSLIGGSKTAARTRIGMKLSSLSKLYHDVRIIDTSAAGLHEQVSPNLLTFL